MRLVLNVENCWNEAKGFASLGRNVSGRLPRQLQRFINGAHFGQNKAEVSG